MLVTDHPLAGPVGSPINTYPALSTAMQNVAEGQEIAWIAACPWVVGGSSSCPCPQVSGVATAAPADTRTAAIHAASVVANPISRRFRQVIDATLRSRVTASHP
jgi:hypothetical protein